MRRIHAVGASEFVGPAPRRNNQRSCQSLAPTLNDTCVVTASSQRTRQCAPRSAVVTGSLNKLRCEMREALRHENPSRCPSRVAKRTTRRQPGPQNTEMVDTLHVSIIICVMTIKDSFVQRSRRHTVTTVSICMVKIRTCCCENAFRAQLE